MMMKISIPIEASNKAVKEGRVGPILETALAAMRPEAVYFYPGEGHRNMLLVIDVADTSDIPALGEPFFQGLDARISFTPVMNLQDFKAGMAKLAKMAGERPHA
jgi:hypothetical protein